MCQNIMSIHIMSYQHVSLHTHLIHLRSSNGVVFLHRSPEEHLLEVPHTAPSPSIIIIIVSATAAPYTRTRTCTRTATTLIPSTIP